MIDKQQGRRAKRARLTGLVMSCVTAVALTGALTGVLIGPPPAGAAGFGHHDIGRMALPPLDPAALAGAIAGLPDTDATAAIVQVRGAAGQWQGTSGVTSLLDRQRVPANTRYRIGSITKVFAATVVLQLVAEGRIGLDEPVQRYLPGMLPPGYPPIEVRWLLNHTSGLPTDLSPVIGSGPAWEIRHRYDQWTPAQLVAAATRHPLKFRPGTTQDYNNINYVLAGMLIEKVTGEPYGQEIRARILRPLHLDHTTVPGADPTLPAPHADGYQALTDGGRKRLVDVTTMNQSLAWAAGEMISTTQDLDRFITALFHGDLLPPAQLREAFSIPDVPYLNGSPTDPSGSGGRAYYSTGGLMRIVLPNGTTLWGKNGARPGYLSGVFATRDLERRVVYSVNSTNAEQPGQDPVVTRIVLAAFVDR
ncbi:MAG TPA: serine hydrolase domain-containing protein [Streptosporangiaceae bacterium]